MQSCAWAVQLHGAHARLRSPAGFGFRVQGLGSSELRQALVILGWFSNEGMLVDPIPKDPSYNNHILWESHTRKRYDGFGE